MTVVIAKGAITQELHQASGNRTTQTKPVISYYSKVII